jgi:hypothetical protein
MRSTTDRPRTRRNPRNPARTLVAVALLATAGAWAAQPEGRADEPRPYTAELADRHGLRPRSVQVSTTAVATVVTVRDQVYPRRTQEEQESLARQLARDLTGFEDLTAAGMDSVAVRFVRTVRSDLRTVRRVTSFSYALADLEDMARVER